jgi:hypothetical protein
MSTSTVKADANQFMGESNLTQIAEYVVEWVKGAKDHHGLHIDYIGKWNEKAVPDAYPVALRKVLDDNGLSSTEIVGGGLRGSGNSVEIVCLVCVVWGGVGYTRCAGRLRGGGGLPL